MARFKKIPSFVEAEQFWPHHPPLPFANKGACCFGPEGWYVVTAHGQETKIVPGDWIIAEPDGRGYYPCKADIFANSYESAPHLVMVCGVDCRPGDSICNNYCNLAPQKGPMSGAPPAGPDVL